MEIARVNRRFDMTIGADVSEVARILDTLEEFGVANGISREECLRFGLALEELVANVLSHGAAVEKGSSITLAVQYGEGMLRAEIADDGPPFDPLGKVTEAPRGRIEDRAAGGLGLVLVKSIVDRLDYARAGGFNRVKIEMKVKAARADSAGERNT